MINFKIRVTRLVLSHTEIQAIATWSYPVSRSYRHLCLRRVLIGSFCSSYFLWLELCFLFGITSLIHKPFLIFRPVTYESGDHRGSQLKAYTLLWHYVDMRYITLRWRALHCVTLAYVTLRFVGIRYLSRSLYKQIHFEGMFSSSLIILVKF